jgi:carbamoyltransferase
MACSRCPGPGRPPDLSRDASVTLLCVWILGYHGPPIGWHDGSVCLIDGDGRIWAFAENERFSRTKHAIRESPLLAVEHCLAVAGITRDDIDVVAVGWDLPILFSWLNQPWTFDRPRDLLVEHLGWTRGRRSPDVVFCSHHRCHAASAFYASGFSEAAVLVVDGQGEEEATSVYTAGYGQPIVRHERWPTSASLGFMYEGACRAIGLDFLEAGKTMGLASYGRGRFEPELLMDWDGDTYRQPFEAGNDATYKEMVAAWATELSSRFDGLPRSTPTADLHKDEVAVLVAYSAQATIEYVVPRLAERARQSTGMTNLCLAGGVGLNCSMNGTLEPPVYVPPIAYDAGVALGAAWLVAPPAAPGPPLDPFLGRAIGPHEAADQARAAGLRVCDYETDDVVSRLLNGEVGAVAWGRAEIGARALGHRSILALPNRAEVADHVNRLKSRELWRPLAPVGLPRVEGDLWAAHPLLHKYMLGAVEVTDRGRRLIPATVHVDGTARAQIVDDSDDGPLAEILAGVEAAGYPPVLMNTSFNGRGEPIVNTAAEALATFDNLGLDFLVAGDVVVSPT